MPRYKEKQKVPANFADTRLSKPNFGAAKETQAGVVNYHNYGELEGRSAKQIGDGIVAGVKQGIGIHKKFTLADLRYAHEDLAEKYMNGTTPEEVAQQEIEAEAAYETKDNMWAAFTSPNVDGNGDKIVESINVATQNAGKEQKKLALMIKQGKITVDQYVAQATLLTKKQIARNPTLADEIIAQTEKHMKISGVKDRVDIEQAENKAAKKEELRQNVQLEASYLKIFTTVLLKKDGSRDYKGMRAALNERQTHKSKVQESVELVANEDIESTKKISLLKEVGPDGKSGFQAIDSENSLAFHRDIGNLTKPLLANSSMGNRELIVEEVEQRYEVEIQAVNDFFVQFQGNKYTEALRKNAVDRLNASKTRIVASVMGDTAAKIGKNNTQIINDNIAQLTYDTTGLNEAGITAAEKMWDGMSNETKYKNLPLMKEMMLLTKNTMLLKQLQLEKVNSGKPMSISRTERKLYKMDASPESIEFLMKGSARSLTEALEAGKTNTQEDLTMFNSSYLLTAVNIGNADTDSGRVTEYDSAMKLWGSTEGLEWAKVLTPETKSKAEEIVGQANGAYDNSLKTTVKRLKVIGISIEPQMINGSLTFSGNNIHEVRSLTNNISYRVGLTRKVLSSLHGLSPNDPKVTEMLLNKMPFLKNMLEPKEENNKGK